MRERQTKIGSSEPKWQVKNHGTFTRKRQENDGVPLWNNMKGTDLCAKSRRAVDLKELRVVQEMDFVFLDV